MHDAMALAMLTGMRAEELVNLRVEDCQGGVFGVRRSKTAAGERTVPIHPDLARLVAWRTKDKAAGALLMHETARWQDPADALGKRFRTYRERCGVDVVVKGKRRALTNFHSWRRAFISRALRAGHQEHIVAVVVGHRHNSMTAGPSYHGGPSMEQLRAVVESVKLPPEVHLTERHTTDRSHAGGLLVRASP